MGSAPETEIEVLTNEATTEEGFICVIYNDMFKLYGDNTYKIGKTKDIAMRIQQYVTSYIKPVEVKFLSVQCLNYHIAEKLVFIRLSEYRITHNREFFAVELALAIDCIEDVVTFVNADINGAQEQVFTYFEQQRKVRNHEYRKTEQQRIKAQQRYQANKEAIIEYGKKYKEEHKYRIKELEKIYKTTHKEQAKERYNLKRDELLEKGKQWRLNNVDKVKEYRQPVICGICNSSYLNHHKKRHLNTFKHKFALQNNTSQEDSKDTD